MSARRGVTAGEIASTVADIGVFYDRGAKSRGRAPTCGRQEDLGEQAPRFAVCVSAARKARVRPHHLSKKRF
jgi:hypothetical protein